MKHEVVLYALGVEGTDWWMMTDLLRDPPEPQILSDEKKHWRDQLTGNIDMISS